MSCGMWRHIFCPSFSWEEGWTVSQNQDNSCVMRFMSERWNLVKYLPQSRVPSRTRRSTFHCQICIFSHEQQGEKLNCRQFVPTNGWFLMVQSDGAGPAKPHSKNSAAQIELLRSWSGVGVAADWRRTPLLGLNEPPHNPSAGRRDKRWTLATVATLTAVTLGVEV